jgi:hypothetical protein
VNVKEGIRGKRIDCKKKDPNISVEVLKKAVTYSPTVRQYHLR